MRNRRAVKRFSIKSLGANYQKPVQAKSKSRAKKIKRQQFITKLEVLAVSVLLLVVLFMSLRVSTDAVVTIIDPQDQYSQAATDRIRTEAKARLANSFSANPLEKTKLFVPRSDIVSALESIPEVRLAGLVVPSSGSRPEVTIELAQVAALYQRGNETLVISSLGRVLSTSDSLQSVDSLPLVIDQVLALDEDSSSSEVVVSPQVLESITTLKSIFEGQGINVSSYRLAQNPGEIRVLPNSGPELIFYSGERVAEQGAGVAAYINQLSPSELQSLSYIDGRIVGRIVYQ